jgi:hypothetical protein
LARTREAIAELETKPNLTWYPTNYNVRGSPLDLSRPVVLKYGGQPDFQHITMGVPTYDSLYRRKMVELQNRADAIESAIRAYEKVLSNWSPDKYPTTGAAVKVDTVHMKHTYTTVKGTKTAPLCSPFKRGRMSVSKMTEDIAQVTCKKCRADCLCGW